MRTVTRTLIAALLVLSASSLRAQTAADPSGPWEGTIQIQDTLLNIEIDLAKNNKGEMAGTFGQPAQQVKGLPSSTVAVDGRSVHFVLKAVQPATFDAPLSADGGSMTGTAAQGGYTIPFTLTRRGDARIAAVPKSAAIGKELEGTWNGRLETNGGQMRLIVK